MKELNSVLLRWAMSVFCTALMLSNVHAYEDEINQLMAYVESTQCQYERNGKKHSGAQAVKHIQKKYDYFREDIASAEDFIRLAAKESTLSGRAYQVHCEGRPAITSEEWLLQELARIRATNL